jgi:beta-glucosidase
VTNTGSRAGADLVQLYIAALGSRVDRAPRELKAIARVDLAPGESRTIRLTLPVSDLAYYDKGWIVEPIEYEAIAARDAEDEGRRARFRVVGDRLREEG